MRKIFRVTLIGLVFILTACGEPSQAEMKQSVIATLKNDSKISKEFIESLNIQYGNGILALYDNCPELVKVNDEKLSQEYKKKEKSRKGDVWGNLLAVGMGDNMWDKTMKFRNECQQMRYRASDLSRMIDGVKEVKMLK